MILAKIREIYERRAKERKPPKGNPTAHRFGKCAAQSQLLMHPDVSRPEPYQIRALMTMEEGDMIEKWWSEAIEEAFPRQSGLAQELFYFSIPVPANEAETIRLKIEGRKLWGTVMPGFVRPWIKMGEDGRPKMRLAPRDPRQPLRPKPMGFVLDPKAGILYAPVYVDRIILHPAWNELVVLEKKSMSSFQFRRAMLGNLSYEYRCQLAGTAEATGLKAACFLLYKKDTAHLCELAYVQNADRVRVTLVLPNGTQEVYFASADMERLVTSDGKEMDIPHDLQWDGASTWVPFDASLLDAIRHRVRRVLLVGEHGPWYREAGPDFRCSDCLGQGELTCRNCNGTGVGKTSTTGRQCGRCKGTLKQKCEKCEGKGWFDEVALPQMPCVYCPVTRVCYPFARLVVTDKPRYLVTRSDWIASGLTFHPPEGPAPVPPPPVLASASASVPQPEADVDSGGPNGNGADPTGTPGQAEMFVS